MEVDREYPMRGRLRPIMHVTCCMSSSESEPEITRPSREHHTPRLPFACQHFKFAKSTDPDAVRAGASPRSSQGGRHAHVPFEAVPAGDVELAFMESSDLSSENEEDRRHPDSLRASLKRIMRKVRNIAPSNNMDDLQRVFAQLSVQCDTDRLCTEHSGDDAARAVSPTGVCEMALAALSLSQCAVGTEKEQGQPTRRLPSPPPGFSCPMCGHVFSLRKTRDRHKNVCAAKV